MGLEQVMDWFFGKMAHYMDVGIYYDVERMLEFVVRRDVAIEEETLP